MNDNYKSSVQKIRKIDNKYNFSQQVDSLSVRYCKTQNDYIPPDTLDYIIGVLILLLLLVNLGCTVYYFFWPPENGEGKKIFLKTSKEVGPVVYLFITFIIA